MRKTFRRDKLKRLCQAGRLVCASSYSFDDMYGESRSAKEMPVAYKDGIVMLDDYHFTGNCGRASLAENGNVHLHVHSNLNFTFRILSEAEVAAANAKQPTAVRANANAEAISDLSWRGFGDVQAPPRPRVYKSTWTKMQDTPGVYLTLPGSDSVWCGFSDEAEARTCLLVLRAAGWRVTVRI